MQKSSGAEPAVLKSSFLPEPAPSARDAGLGAQVGLRGTQVQVSWHAARTPLLNRFLFLPPQNLRTCQSSPR